MNVLTKYRLSVAALLVVGLAVAFGPSAAQAQSSDQVALISLSSYDEIIEDIGFVGKLIGKPETVQQMEGMLMFMTQGKGLAGLDKSKPIGIAAYAQGEELSAVAMIPISDKDAMVELLKGFQIPIEEGDDGVMEITAPGNQTVYAKAVDNWILLAQQAEQLTAAPSDPSKVIGSLSGTYDIGARIYVQNIPQNLREMAIGALKGGLEQGLEREGEESDEEYELRKQITIKQVEQFEQVLQEMDELTIGWTLDSKEERTYLDFAFTAVAETELAEQTAAYADAKTDYAGFYQPDAASMITFSSVMAQEEINQALEMFSGLKTQVMNEIENESDLPDEKSKVIVKAAMNDFFDAFVETLKAGKADGGAVLHLSPDALTLVAGGLCTEPDKVKEGLKKLEALVEEEPNFPGIEWDAANHAGVSFHTMRVPIPDEGEETDNAKVLFGDELEVVLGTGDNSIYVALGRGALATCKAVIDESKANLGKSTTPLEMSVSLGQIMEVAAAFEADPVVAMIADTLKAEAQGSDHIRITATVIERGVKYRVELEKGVLRAIGKAAEMNQ